MGRIRARNAPSSPSNVETDDTVHRLIDAHARQPPDSLADDDMTEEIPGRRQHSKQDHSKDD